MGFIILIVLGGIIGWLASIVMRIDDVQGILLSAGVGIFSTIAAGLVTSSGSLIGGISGISLVLSFLGAIAVLAVFHYFRRNSAH